MIFMVYYSELQFLFSAKTCIICHVLMSPSYVMPQNFLFLMPSIRCPESANQLVYIWRTRFFLRKQRKMYTIKLIKNSETAILIWSYQVLPWARKEEFRIHSKKYPKKNKQKNSLDDNKYCHFLRKGNIHFMNLQYQYICVIE